MVGSRVVIEIEDARRSRVDERRTRQAKRVNRLEQAPRRPDWRRLARPRALDRLAPPLQADFAGHRLPYARSRTCATSRSKRGKREKMRCAPRRREQGGEVAVLSQRARQRFAMRVGRASAVRPRSVDREQAAATRRPSPQQHVVGAHRRPGRHRFGRGRPRADARQPQLGSRRSESRPVPITTSSMLRAPALGEHRRSVCLVDLVRRVAGQAQMPSAGTAASRGATCRRSGSRRCRSPRSARGPGRCGSHRHRPPSHGSSFAGRLSCARVAAAPTPR